MPHIAKIGAILGPREEMHYKTLRTRRCGLQQSHAWQP